jgi:hypothetical protein
MKRAKRNQAAGFAEPNATSTEQDVLLLGKAEAGSISLALASCLGLDRRGRGIASRPARGRGGGAIGRRGPD